MKTEINQFLEVQIEAAEELCGEFSDKEKEFMKNDFFNKFEKIEGACLNIAYYDNLALTNKFVNDIKTTLGGTVRYNSIEKKIKKVAVCSGSGSDYLELANELECDALLTGDASHHAFLDANEMDILLVAAGHFETENIAIKPLLEKIENEFNISCVLAVQNTPIITI